MNGWDHGSRVLARPRFPARSLRTAGSPCPTTAGTHQASHAIRLPIGKVFKHLTLLIPIGVILNLALTASTTDVETVFAQGRLALGYLSLAVVLGFVPWLTHTLRIAVWTRLLGLRVAFADLLCMVVGSDLGSAVSPTAVGGGYVKLGLLIERGLAPGAAASLMTLGSVEDGLFFCIALPLALALSPLRASAGGAHVQELLCNHAPLMLGGIGCVAGIGWLMVCKNRERLLVRRIAAAWRDYIRVYRLIARRGKMRLALTLALTGIQWSCRYSVITALLAVFHVNADPFRFFALQWFVFTLGVLVPTPGAVGGLEAAFLLVHRGLIPDSLLGMVTACWRFLTYYMQLLVGSVVFSVLRIRAVTERAARQAEPAS